MKKRLAACCLLACLICGLFGCGSREEELPTLVIGCDNYKPYNYTDDDGEPAGLDVELAREACARMGYTPVFLRIDWNRREELLNDGVVDCLWSCFTMDGQKDTFAWVGPYMRSRQVVAVAENSPIYHLSDLDGKTVAVRVGSKAESVFLTQSDVPRVERLYALTDLAEAVTALRYEYVDACAGYAAAVREQLNNAGIAYRFLEEDLVHAQFGVAFAKNSDPALRESLQSALEQMRRDGTTEEILSHYGVDLTKPLEEAGI